MNLPRNRLMIVGLGIVVFLFLGDMAYRKFYSEPVAEYGNQKKLLTKRLRETKAATTKAQRAVAQLDELEKASLPWDPEVARERYQDWLLQVAKDAKLENTSIDASDPASVTISAGRGKRPTEIYKRFSFSLRGRGDFERVTRFLYDFYRAGHLHKIRSMSLNPVNQGQEIDVSLSIEALALPNADRETELTTVVSERLAQTDVHNYQLIAQRNFFGTGSTETAWKQVLLSAVTSDAQGVGEAWFTVGTDSQTRILQLGQALTMPALEVRVVGLDETTATISIDGRLYKISIGQNLAEAVPVEGTGPVEPAGSSEPVGTVGS